MQNHLSKACIVMAMSAIAIFGADNSIGTWKLNVEKSKYAPPPMPVKSLTTVRETADGGVKVTTSGERADGTKIDATYTAKYDGTASSVTGTGAPYDTISIKQAGANRLTDERKNTSGPYKATGRTAISSDGKTMTVTSRGTNADGKAFTSTFVYEKQ